MNRMIVTTLAAGAVAALLAGPLAARSADDVKARQAGFHEVGGAFKATLDELRGSDPKVGVIRQAAAKISIASTRIGTWFPAGSGPEAGVKTEALPAIWAQPARFAEARGAFVAAAAKFQTAANGGNLDAIRAEARNLGGTCKGCHENFRKRD